MKWTIDPSHSTAEFTVRHLMITNVKGRFGKLEGTVNYDPEKPEGKGLRAWKDLSHNHELRAAATSKGQK